MYYTQECYVERDDDEVVLSIEFDVSPLIRGRYSGPPEHCYPDEGGYAEVVKILCDGKPWDGELTTDEETGFCEDAYEKCMTEIAEAKADRYLDRDDYYDRYDY